MNQTSRSPMRYLAPLALIAAAVVFFAVIAGGIVGGDEGSGDGTQAAEQAGRGGGGGGGGDGGNRSAPDTYEVQEGDTLDAISAETGVSVEEILELNPDLDPQSLISGQELQLSE